MSRDNEITDELNKEMTQALLQLQQLVNNDRSQTPELLSVVKIFLLGVIFTAVDLVEVHSPGSAPLLYADIEASAKLGGLRAPYYMNKNKKTQTKTQVLYAFLLIQSCADQLFYRMVCSRLI